jgi:hypothetical protein
MIYIYILDLLVIFIAMPKCVALKRECTQHFSLKKKIYAWNKSAFGVL